MCIAIVKTKDGNITDKQLKNCFESNPDGAGIAYSHNGSLWIVKGIFTSKEFIEQYHKAVELADGAMLIHCRISTSGKIDKTNCHPHVVHDNCVMIHNGVLKIDVPKDSKVSDTVLYVQQFLQKLPKNFMLDKGIINLITHDIGAGNKFCFLNAKGEFAIANEKAGHWKDGVWFSNHSYEDWGCYGKKTKYGYVTYGSSKNLSTTGSNTLSPYSYDYDYEYDDEYYQLTDKEKEKMEQVIYNLNTEQFIRLGLSPVYDFWTSSLKRVDFEVDELNEGEKTLEELDEYLYSIYEELYYNAVDEILVEYGADYEGAVASQKLAEYEDFILKQYAIGTTSAEEKEWEDINNNYKVKLSDVEIDDIDEEDDIDVNDVIDAEFTTDDSNDILTRYDNKELIKSVNETNPF